MKRTNYLGCSELAAALGKNPYKGLFQLWLEKTGESQPIVEDSLPMEIGTALEPLIRQRYADFTGKTVVVSGARIDEPPTMHRELPWFGCHPDGVLPEDKVVVQCKWSGSRQRARWGEPFTDDIPPEYLIQVVGEMAILEYERAHIPVILDGEFRIYQVVRDLEYEAHVLALAARFWDLVQRRERPPMDASDAARDWLLSKHPTAGKHRRAASTLEEQWAAELQRAELALKKAEADKATAKANLEELIGADKGIEGAFGRVTRVVNRGHPKTDWDGLIAKYRITAEDFEAFTTRKPFSYLLPKFNDEKAPSAEEKAA